MIHIVISISIVGLKYNTTIPIRIPLHHKNAVMIELYLSAIYQNIIAKNTLIISYIPISNQYDIYSGCSERYIGMINHNDPKKIHSQNAILSGIRGNFSQRCINIRP
jgi:hypothetical protein